MENKNNPVENEDNPRGLVHTSPYHADVVKLVNTEDLKSLARRACRFKSDRRHYENNRAVDARGTPMVA